MIVSYSFPELHDKSFDVDSDYLDYLGTYGAKLLAKSIAKAAWLDSEDKEEFPLVVRLINEENDHQDYTVDLSFTPTFEIID